MSIAISNIRKRWDDLVKLRRQKLTIQNADEHYENDVRDLIRVVEALHLTCCRLNMKWHEAAGKKPLDLEYYYQQIDRSIDKLLIQKNITPQKILKPNG